MGYTVKMTKQERVDFEQFCKDSAYLSEITEQLRSEHPDCFVAVYKGEVIGATPNLLDLEAQVVSHGAPFNRCATTFIHKVKPHFILTAA